MLNTWRAGTLFPSPHAQGGAVGLARWCAHWALCKHGCTHPPLLRSGSKAGGGAFLEVAIDVHSLGRPWGRGKGEEAVVVSF